MNGRDDVFGYEHDHEQEHVYVIVRRWRWTWKARTLARALISGPLRR